jgi:alpha-L-rhamnosidase
MNNAITPQDFSDIRWRGHWIWVEPPAMPSGQFPGMDAAEPRAEAHGLFRKTFTLEDVPARVPARLTADSRYRLFVNGQEASRGPLRSQPRRLHYDLLDLAPYLKAGENTLAVYVKYYGTVKSFWMPAVPSMTLGKTGVLVFEADLGQAGWLVSDASWKAAKCEAWSPAPEAVGPVPGGIPEEIFDAARFPYGWEQPGFDDSAWGDAQVIPSLHIGGYAHSQPPTDPYGPLYPRPVALLSGETRQPVAIQVEILQGPPDISAPGPGRRILASISRPVTGSQPAEGLPLACELPEGGAARLLIDFGRIVAGFVQFEVAAPAGTVLDLAYVEDPLKSAEVAGLGGPSGARYVARGENDRFLAFDSTGLRYVYLLAHGASGPLSVRSFAVKENLYPWTPGASFTCSDETLNRIFLAGIRTVQLNSQDAFMDCPTREQRAWVGDSVVHQMVHLATNLDWRLAWHYLTLGNSPRYDGILPMSVAGDIEWGGSITIPDWSLHWVHGVYNLYRFTGDKKAVTAFMPTVARILRWYEPFQNVQGQLKDLVEWNLVDWAALSNEDTSGVITALWARGLREFAEMAAWLGENASRAWAEEVYDKARAGFEAFWDEARGSYVDHLKDGVRQPEMSQLGGAFGIVSGLAPKERWSRIIDTITDPEKLVVRSWTGGESGDYSPEKMQKQILGIYEPDWDVEKQIVIGEPFISYVVHDAVAQAGLADRLPELYQRWAGFLVNGYDTIGECWGWGTHVHGWSCTPTKDMIFYTLGVTPAAPGYTAARVAPRLGGLAWAEGKVPTPFGLISVRAEPGKVTVDSPVPVVVDLPGQPQQQLPAGQHEVTAER